MSKIICSEGVILDYREFGEFDHLLIVFSRDFGKQEILLKGSRKTNSKLRFCLQKFMVMEYEVVKARTFDRLIFFRMKSCFDKKNLHEQIELKLYSLYNILSEILIKQLHLDQAEPEIYKEFVALLQGKRIYTQDLINLYFNFFVFRLFYLFGLGINLSHCVVSGQKKGKRFFLSFRHGGLVEGQYVEDGYGYLPVDTKIIMVLRTMQGGYWDRNLQMFDNLSVDAKNLILKMGVIYLYYYDIQLKAFRFFQKMI